MRAPTRWALFNAQPFKNAVWNGMAVRPRSGVDGFGAEHVQPVAGVQTQCSQADRGSGLALTTDFLSGHVYGLCTSDPIGLSWYELARESGGGQIQYPVAAATLGCLGAWGAVGERPTVTG
jgi:hypothetical protein